MKQKRWFHTTTKDNFKKIKKEGLRKGTYLARNLNELIRMIYLPLFTDLIKCEVILSVKYIPNCYDPTNWELVTSKPIPSSSIKLMKYL